MATRTLALVAMIAVFCTACGRHRQRVAKIPVPPPASTAKSAPAPPPPADQSEPERRSESASQRYVEVGYASWYGNPYHGRRAANGEIYDMNKLTAAHLTLPFGTQIKVTDLENNRTVNVRINDRGPFVKGRILDLSLAAAKQIQMVGPGTALVRIEVLSMPAEPDFGSFVVQVGAFKDRSTGEKLRDRLNRRYGNAFMETFQGQDGVVYRVRLGPKQSLSQATQLASQLGREMLRSFVVRVDN
ncbi:MAG: septal ring lytic transglycosylase RlpA family protein [Acidobacteria bacterium]|nr:septal ring lytic transglycosylase RlpA family protein [Acidobacteriota bacterium]